MSKKRKICSNCKFKAKCGDLPAFCLLIYYTPIAALLFMLLYFLFTMEL